MRKAILCILASLFLIHTAFAQSVLKKEFETKKGKILEIDLRSGGSIDIVGWDEETILVEAFLDKNARRDCDIRFDEHSSGLEIESRCHERHGSGRNIELEVKVPRQYNLDIVTSGGEIRIENVEGNIDGKTMGGGLDLRDLKGEIALTTQGGTIKCRGLEGLVDLYTYGGNITCRNSEVDGSVRTLGGNIQIQDVAGNLKAETNGGNVTYDGVTARNKGGDDKIVRISTLGGNIEVDEAPVGADVRTNGGNIEIGRAGKFVKARTLGGDIYIDEIDGWIEAQTNGGDISVTMVGDPDKGERNVEIVSLGGDIELTVPPKLSMDFDITLAYTRNSNKNYEIISDFEMNIEETDRWERSHGTARRYIYGTGTINGGNNKIILETINGDIIIREGK